MVPRSPSQRSSGGRRPAAAGRAIDELLAQARLFVFDVDGTLTDGRIAYAGAEEIATFHVHDGQALVWLREAGVHVAWISGRGSVAVRRRAEELGVREVHLAARDKARVLGELQERLGVDARDTIAMGDDLPDLAFHSRAALLVAPSSARPEVRERAGLVTAAAGGAGAVRELVERTLAARGAWKQRVARGVRASE